MPHDYIYGFPCTKNPLDFEPDPERCTEAEIAAWESDCDAVRAGKESEDPRKGTGWFGAGDAVLHIDTTRWGIGTSTIRE